LTELVKVDARILNEVLSDDCAVLALHIPTDLDYFKGHFDQAPILAGVVQLHWAAEFAQQYLDIAPTDVMDIQVLKFQEMILPGHEVVLTLTKKSTEKVLFSYQSTMQNGDVKSHSSGRLIFAAAECINISAGSKAGEA
jgi:3-hydroxymyristoyl/3-hydroxydecanoyl-(acyl carrier protein) dehydratase